MKTKLSVIICCFNSSQRIVETLRHLTLQTFKGSWEIILVDNASTDNTVSLAREYWDNNGPESVACKIEYENQPGLMNARKKGVMCSSSTFLMFCDDDNWLENDYLENGYQILLSDLTIGGLGGQTIPQFAGDEHKPTWFDEYSQCFAIGKQSSNTGYVEMLFGAGLFLRTDIAKEIFTSREFYLSDRKGLSLASGGDSEICNKVLLSGFNLFYSDKLILRHFLPTSRLTVQYLIELHKGIARSQPILNLYHQVIYNEPLRPYYWLKDIAKLSLLIIKYELKYVFKNKPLFKSILLQSWKSQLSTYLKLNFSLNQIYDEIKKEKIRNSQRLHSLN